MSIFRNIVANGMQSGRQADTVEIATTPDLANQQGVTFTVCQTFGDGAPQGGSMVTVSLEDGRELAGWLIEHCVNGPLVGMAVAYRCTDHNCAEEDQEVSSQHEHTPAVRICGEQGCSHFQERVTMPHAHE